MLLMADIPITYSVFMKLTRTRSSLGQRKQDAIAGRYVDLAHVWSTSVH